MLILAAIAFAITNMLGGRFEDVWGEKPPISGRLFWRCIMSGIILACVASEYYSLGVTTYVLLAGIAGSAVWFPSGWSFEEQHGQPDPSKYPTIVRKVAYKIWPEDGELSTNRHRGIFLKGVRGMYDGITFLLLLPINKYAMLIWPLTYSMGFVFYLMAKITPGFRQDVLAGEAAYGLTRGLLLAITVVTADLSIWQAFFS